MPANWMRSLSTSYRRARRKFPDEHLLLTCDIDGTVIDMRHVILAVLWAYDRAHSTSYFDRLRLSRIKVHENQVGRLLASLDLPAGIREEVLAWYLEQRWEPDVILESHRPFPGVMEMIRWFQIQDNTSVGFITGRPERLREVTLQSLNQLGAPYGVQIPNDLLCMNPSDWEQGVAESKVRALDDFRQRGYHVFAYIDNEPDLIKAVARHDTTKGIRVLHANTVFESIRTHLPQRTAHGASYRLAQLIPGEDALPSQVQLVRKAVSNKINLRQFLASTVRWAGVDVHLDASRSRLMLRPESFMTSLALEMAWLGPEDVVESVKQRGRGIQLDLMAGGLLVDMVLNMLTEKALDDRDIWFNGRIEHLGQKGFRQLTERHPGAIIQCPIDFLKPLVMAAPEKARDSLKMLRDWGIGRFSINWGQPELRRLFDTLRDWGYDVNIQDPPDLESFLQAVLLLPRSVTSDFDFPQWNRRGRPATPPERRGRKRRRSPSKSRATTSRAGKVNRTKG
jgi:hypothetical protein